MREKAQAMTSLGNRAGALRGQGRMHQGLQFLDIIFLALIAGFIFFRLRAVLGRRTGQERPPTNPYASRTNSGVSREETARALPGPEGRREESPAVSSPAQAGIGRIKLADRDFDEASFLEGAQAAYEMVVGAFASGDRATLRDLVSPDVYHGFDIVLTEREQKGWKGETTIVGIDKTEIAAADMQGSEAVVTVRFVSEMVTSVKDAEGRVVEGNPTVPHTVTDLWSFSRNTKSRDPNWTLVATSGEA